jgi:hypothetical protein
VALKVVDHSCLFGRQDAPHGQQHFHLGLFQTGSRLSYLVDLCERLRFVWRLCFHLEAEDGVLFFQVSTQVDCLNFVILRNSVEFPDLVIIDMKFLHENGILPPF